MHELGITRSIVSLCGERAGGRRVSRVTLEIGQLSAVVPDSIRFCFDVVSQGTALEGARLEILQIPGRARCRGCGQSAEVATRVFRCPACQSREVQLLSGEELKIKEMETV